MQPLREGIGGGGDASVDGAGGDVHQTHQDAAEKIGEGVAEAAQHGAAAGVGESPLPPQKAEKQRQQLQRQQRQHHHRRLPQAVHAGGKAEQQRQTQGEGAGLLRCLQRAGVVPEDQKERDEIAGIITGHHKKELALRLQQQAGAHGGGAEHQQGDQPMAAAADKGPQHPVKTQQHQQAHHRRGQAHRQVHAAREPVEQRRQHRRRDNIVLVAENPVGGEEAFLPPDLPGQSHVRVHITVAEDLLIAEVQHREHGQKGQQSQRGQKGYELVPALVHGIASSRKKDWSQSNTRRRGMQAGAPEGGEEK